MTNAALFDIYAKLGNSDQAAAAQVRLHRTLARRSPPIDERRLMPDSASAFSSDADRP